MDNEIIVSLGIALGVFGLSVFGAIQLRNASCEATASAMKLQAEYSVLTDCMVTTHDGRVVPLAAYRDIRIQEQ